MIQNFQIDEEFRDSIPPLHDDEREGLQASLITEGCRDALTVWRGLLIDGHHRFEVCTALGIDFQTREIELESRAHALAWICRNQMARRNLTAYQRAELALKLKDALSTQALERMLAGKSDPPLNSAEGSKGDTRDVLANMAGVGHDTIARVERIRTAAIPAVQKMAQTGDISIHAAAKIAVLPAETQRTIVAIPEKRARSKAIQDAAPQAHSAHASQKPRAPSGKPKPDTEAETTQNLRAERETMAETIRDLSDQVDTLKIAAKGDTTMIREMGILKESLRLANLARDTGIHTIDQLRGEVKMLRRQLKGAK